MRVSQSSVSSSVLQRTVEVSLEGPSPSRRSARLCTPRRDLADASANARSALLAMRHHAEQTRATGCTPSSSIVMLHFRRLALHAVHARFVRRSSAAGSRRCHHVYGSVRARERERGEERDKSPTRCSDLSLFAHLRYYESKCVTERPFGNSGHCRGHACWSGIPALRLRRRLRIPTLPTPTLFILHIKRRLSRNENPTGYSDR